MKARVSRFSTWSALVWVGSFGLGVTVFLAVADELHFEYHSYQDIVAVPAFRLYPELGDWWLYLLALALIPTLTLVGYGLWVGLVSLCHRLQGGVDQVDVAVFALSYLVWWVHPLTYAFEHHLGSVPLWLLVGIFAVSNGAYLGYRWLQRRPQAEPTAGPPSLSIQGAMALIGAGLGLAVMRAPWSAPSPGGLLLTIIGSAFVLWALWMSGAYLLGRTLNASWQAAATALAMGCLPLSLLFLVPLPWWEVRQGGELVESHDSALVSFLLLFVALGMAVGVSIWTVRRLKTGRPPANRVFWQWFFLLVIPVLLYALSYSPNIYRRPLDLFHEGERLAPAQAMMDGKVPYRDVLFVHGFLRDPAVALVAFRLFGVSVAALRTLEQILSPLGLIATYYLVYACIGGWGALLYSLLIATGFWFYYWDWRITPAIFALVFLVLYVRQRRTGWIVAAGAASFVALATGFDTGVTAVAACVTVICALTIFRWREVKLKPILGYSLPLVVCFSCVLLYLAHHDALKSFVDWHMHIQDVSRDWTGRPFPLPVQGLNEAWQAYFFPLASIVALAFLLWSLVTNRWQRTHWIVLALLVANVLLGNRNVVKGADVAGGLSMGSHFAPLLLLVLLGIASTRNRLLSMSVAAVLSVALLLPVPTAGAAGATLLEALERSAMSRQAEIPEDWVRSETNRIGPLFLPSEQEDSLAQISAFLASESYWDFTDHAALYFIADSQNPTRFDAALHVVTRENQLEVIRDLAQSPPRYILYRSGTDWDAVLGVDRTLRSFLVSEYLLKTYHFADIVGGFTVLEYGPPGTPSNDLLFRVNLGNVPFLWGKDRVDALEMLGPSSVTGWDFAGGKTAGWQAEHDVARSESVDDGMHLRTGGTDAQVVNLDMEVDPRAVTYVALRMSVTTENDTEITGQLFWRSGSDGFSEEKSVRFAVIPDGQEHLYLLRLASFPSWIWSDLITGLRLDPVTLEGAEVVIRSIELTQVDELGLRDQ